MCYTHSSVYDGESHRAWMSMLVDGGARAFHSVLSIGRAHLVGRVLHSSRCGRGDGVCVHIVLSAVSVFASCVVCCCLVDCPIIVNGACVPVDLTTFVVIVVLACREMDAPGSRDSRFNLGYSMSMLSGETPPDIYGNPGVSLGRPGTSLQQQMSSTRGHNAAMGGCPPRGMKGSPQDMCYEVPTSQAMGLDSCGVQDVTDDTYGTLQAKKSPPSNGKKTKGRVKIKMEYIENKLRRYTTFSKRKTGIMKKAYELSTLTGTQVMLLVASETGHVYTFATRKLQPMITSEAGKALIQTCLNSPDPPSSGGNTGGDQRMSATGFEETELTYNISDEDSKEDEMSVAESSGDSSGGESPPHQQDPEPTPPMPPLLPSPSPEKRNPSDKKQQGSNQQRSQQQAQQQQQQPLSLLYQMPQGVVCPSNSVIFSLSQGNNDHPQFITIPLSMAMAASNGHQTELDLSKRK